MDSRRLIHRETTESILKAFYQVYNSLDYGCLETVYQRALTVALSQQGIRWRSEVPQRVYFLGECVGEYRADLIVDEKVLVEVKAVTNISPIHDRQIYNYLRISDLKVGLILNFGPVPSHHRYVNTRRQMGDKPVQWP